jgi:Ca2+-binding EF-hand superfamily protein
MNIVVAALLMWVERARILSYANPCRYMSESQAFFLLSVLCDRLLPGYYSTTMYGTLLDQKVFESLVEKTMPILWDHLIKSDVQLSVVSLPWFLSLYINSMPLVFAFRVLDVFFLEGPKVLFQVGLAILRINGEELLDATDDGAFISVLKSYFSRLEESAHPTSENQKLRAVTRFQELMVVAFKEFAGITQSTISDQRSKHKDTVLDSIESFAKRTTIRNLGPDSKRLAVQDLASVYDKFFGVLYERQQRMQILQDEAARQTKSSRAKASRLVNGVPTDESIEKGRVGLGPSPTVMDYDAFREFLASITKWAITDSPSSPLKENEKEKNVYLGGSVKHQMSHSPSWSSSNPEPTDHEFMQRLYRKWNVEDKAGLSLQDVVTGLAKVKTARDIMTSISYFFELYDDDGDGRVDREGILRISESLLFLSRRGLEGSLTPTLTTESYHDEIGNLEQEKRGNMNERFLNSVSDFIRRCFEYADPDHPHNRAHTEGEKGDNDAFSIGDDEEQEDLLDLKESAPAPSSPKKSTNLPTAPKATTGPVSTDGQRKISKAETEAANLALDPANPLYINLPTFRMVILADEILEQFFESSFPASFRLSESGTESSQKASTASNLTTFTSFGVSRSSAGTSSAAMVPPGKGLRGVLDNIVTDGMRVAAEVKRRMDEAQRELEKNATARDEYDDDEDGEDGGRASESYGGDAERRSVREGDRDLLTGADAEIETEKEREKVTLLRRASSSKSGDSLSPDSETRTERRASTATQKVVEFER